MATTQFSSIAMHRSERIILEAFDPFEISG